MESATIFTPPSAGLSGVLLSVILLVLGCVPQSVVNPIDDPGVDPGLILCWRLIKIYGHSPSADLRRTVFSYMPKYVHKVLVKRLV